jgi:transcriptional regulator with XRE-family HTH domain
MDERKAGGRARPWVASEAYAAGISAVVQARQSRGVSQRQLAGLLGKSRSFVSKIESRERRLDMIEFVAIARALGMEPEALMAMLNQALPDELDF